MITVRNLLKRKGQETYTVSPETTVSQALEEMARRNVGALIVMAGHRVAGIFSERDFARGSVGAEGPLQQMPVSEMMTSPVVTVGPDMSVDDCMGLMTDRRIRHLPVLEDGRLLGVISIGDLVKAIIDRSRFMIDQLESYISGFR